MSKPTQKQIDYIHDLCDEAGYTGDRKYNAGRDLLGDGSVWRDREGASKLIDALLRKLGREPSPRAPQQRSNDNGYEQPIVHTERDGTRWLEY